MSDEQEDRLSRMPSEIELLPENLRKDVEDSLRLILVKYGRVAYRLIKGLKSGFRYPFNVIVNSIGSVFRRSIQTESENSSSRSKNGHMILMIMQEMVLVDMVPGLV